MRRFCSGVQRLLADALAGQVDDGVEPLERRRVDAARVGIPADLVVAGDRRRARIAARCARRPAAMPTSAEPNRPLAPLIATSTSEMYGLVGYDVRSLRP